MTWTPAVFARGLGGDEALARELIAIFLAEHRTLLDAVRHALAAGDHEAIRRSAHALKGSLGNFIEEGPTSTARSLERATAGASVEDLVPLVRQLEEEVSELADAMRRSLEGR